jgi:hypothetical protein
VLHCEPRGWLVLRAETPRIGGGRQIFTASCKRTRAETQPYAAGTDADANAGLQVDPSSVPTGAGHRQIPRRRDRQNGARLTRVAPTFEVFPREAMLKSPADLPVKSSPLEFFLTTPREALARVRKSGSLPSATSRSRLVN